MQNKHFVIHFGRWFVIIKIPRRFQVWPQQPKELPGHQWLVTRTTEIGHEAEKPVIVVPLPGPDAAEIDARGPTDPEVVAEHLLSAVAAEVSIAPRSQKQGPKCLHLRCQFISAQNLFHMILVSTLSIMREL